MKGDILKKIRELKEHSTNVFLISVVFFIVFYLAGKALTEYQRLFAILELISLVLIFISSLWMIIEDIKRDPKSLVLIAGIAMVYLGVFLVKLRPNDLLYNLLGSYRIL